MTQTTEKNSPQKYVRHAVAALLVLASPPACVASAPDWFVPTPRVVRGSAYEHFLVASAQADARDRKVACKRAHAAAFDKLVVELIAMHETQAEVIAAAGGPSRYEQAMRIFAEKNAALATRTEQQFADSDDRCWVEVRWLLPRHLGEAVQRAVGAPTTEEDVATELRRALAAEESPNGGAAEPSAKATVPADATAAAAVRVSPTAAAAVSRAYPSWFMRLLPIDGCPTHVIAFVGSPGGADSRWLELKQGGEGWFVVDDKRAQSDGWPTVPEIPSCE